MMMVNEIYIVYFFVYICHFVRFCLTSRLIFSVSGYWDPNQAAALDLLSLNETDVMRSLVVKGLQLYIPSSSK